MKKLIALHKSLIMLFIATNILSSSIISAANITFVEKYDQDNNPITNPKSGEVVPSFLFNNNHIFVCQVVVKTDGLERGTEISLNLWDSTNNYVFKGSVDKYGYVVFVVAAPYSAEGYQYKVEARGILTGTRVIIINPTSSGRYDDFKVKWLTPSVDDTYTIKRFPFITQQ